MSRLGPFWCAIACILLFYTEPAIGDGIDENSEDVFEDFSSRSKAAISNGGSDGFPRLSTMIDTPSETLNEDLRPSRPNHSKNQDDESTKNVEADDKESILRSEGIRQNEDYAISDDPGAFNDTTRSIEFGDVRNVNLPVEILELTTESPLSGELDPTTGLSAFDDVIDVTRTEFASQPTNGSDFPTVMEYELESEEVEADPVAASNLKTDSPNASSSMDPASSFPSMSSTIFRPISTFTQEKSSSSRSTSLESAKPTPSESVMSFSSDSKLPSPSDPALFSSSELVLSSSSDPELSSFSEPALSFSSDPVRSSLSDPVHPLIPSMTTIIFRPSSSVSNYSSSPVPALSSIPKVSPIVIHPLSTLSSSKDPGSHSSSSPSDKALELAPSSAPAAVPFTSSTNTDPVSGIFHPKGSDSFPTLTTEGLGTVGHQTTQVESPSPSSAFMLSDFETNPSLRQSEEERFSTSAASSEFNSKTVLTDPPFINIDPTIFNPDEMMDRSLPKKTTPLASTEGNESVDEPMKDLNRVQTKALTTTTTEVVRTTTHSQLEDRKNEESFEVSDDDTPFVGDNMKGLLSAEKNTTPVKTQFESNDSIDRFGSAETPESLSPTTRASIAYKAPFQLRITSIEYMSEFRDPESGKFRKLRDQIVPELREFFSQVLNDFIAVEIVSLTKGSVVVHGMVYTRNSIKDLETVVGRFVDAIAQSGMEIAGNTVDARSITINGIGSRLYVENAQTTVTRDSSFSFILAAIIAVGVIIIIAVAFIFIALNNRHSAGTIKLKESDLGMCETGRVFPEHHVNLTSFGQQPMLPPHGPLSPVSPSTIQMHSIGSHYMARA